MTAVTRRVQPYASRHNDVKSVANGDGVHQLKERISTGTRYCVGSVCKDGIAGTVIAGATGEGQVWEGGKVCLIAVQSV